ncbi:MAG: TfoX/Sxy family DNA transformation protein [Burkholderiales bacterium]|nr:TfoX/Sxy family DNA transformation protein [Burkholderiales bacterium]
MSRATVAPKRLSDCAVLEDLPNVGPAVARDLRALGVRVPHQLRGRDPYALYEALNRRSGQRHDPCLLDTFIAAVRFADGDPPQPWWAFTAERKRTLAARAARPSASSRRPAPVPQPSRSPASAATPGVARLRNLGPASARMLAAAGIGSPARLRALGAVEAWRRVRSRHPRASLNLLWALEGALSDRDWQDVARTERTRLLLALDGAPR